MPDPKTYHVTIDVKASITVEVEADNMEDAKNEAEAIVDSDVTQYIDVANCEVIKVHKPVIQKS